MKLLIFKFYTYSIMISQIFKQNIPNQILFTFLESNALKTEKCYIFNTDSYKKACYNNDLNPFLEECKPYYHHSKCKYLERKLTYNAFTTIIRQICKFKKITYTSQIKYDKSNYTIIYYIYFNE